MRSWHTCGKAENVSLSPRNKLELTLVSEVPIDCRNPASPTAGFAHAGTQATCTSSTPPALSARKRKQGNESLHWFHSVMTHGSLIFEAVFEIWTLSVPRAWRSLSQANWKYRSGRNYRLQRGSGVPKAGRCAYRTARQPRQNPRLLYCCSGFMSNRLVSAISASKCLAKLRLEILEALEESANRETECLVV